MTTLPKGNSVEVDIVRMALEADYEVLEELGRGGMAIVYRARERALDREVAIKVLPAMLAMDQEFVERFQHEARTAGKLEHPNIVPIYRVGQSGQVIYFVMKFLRGQSLSTILRERTKLAAKEVHRILIETSSALGYASKFGVVHRDIKPDNILLDHEGRCVITDFGIAKTQGARLTAPGTSMGTPRYMSPEHAQGIPMDGRSDIYSLGVVAYQCLTGTLPFDGEDPFAVLYKHVNSPLPRPELKSEEENALFGVIERMLAKKPSDRFQNADELLAALGVHATSTTLVNMNSPARLAELVPTEIINTKPTTLLGRVAQFELRGWRLVGAAFGAMVVLAGVSAWAATRSDSETPGAAPAVPTALNAPVRPAGSTTGATASAPLAGGTTGATTQVAVNSSSRLTAPPPRPAPEPFSRCERPASAAARRGLFLMVDQIPNQPAARDLVVNYDVCGLEKDAVYNVDFEVRRIRQNAASRLFRGGVQPVISRFPEKVSGPRSRKSRTLVTAHLPSGTYELKVRIADSNGNLRERTRQYEVLDRR